MRAVDYGSWFDYTRDWEEVIATHPELNVFCTSYEDVKEVGSGLDGNLFS